MIGDLVFILIVIFISGLIGFLIAWFWRTQKHKKELTDCQKPFIDKINRNEEDINLLNNKIEELEKNNKHCEEEKQSLAHRLTEKDNLASKSSNLETELKTQNKSLLEKITELEKKLTICEKEKEIKNIATTEKPVELVFDAQLAKKALGKTVKADDLKIIEGIGPKIEALLKENNIETWYKLSIASAATIRKILLEKGGERYRLHEPATWPHQAKLAFDGKWQELKKLQDELNGGKI